MLVYLLHTGTVGSGGTSCQGTTFIVNSAWSVFATWVFVTWFLSFAVGCTGRMSITYLLDDIWYALTTWLLHIIRQKIVFSFQSVLQE